MTEMQKTYGFMGAGSDAREPEDLPAFPVAAGQTVYTSGMTLRDWLAGHAMNAIISGNLANDCDYPFRENTAARAYAYADAMLTERSKTGTGS